jgi:omega-6 fatty acid desaturase (delta-12 desaturase)
MSERVKSKGNQIEAPVVEPSVARKWDRLLAPYKRSNNRRATTQLLVTAGLFVVFWILMLRSLEGPYVWTLLLSLPAGFCSIRLFIFQHDCGHGSFFSSRKANNAVGGILGIITLIPYAYWRRTHAIHHASSGNLERREFGDVSTITVKEFLARPWYRQLTYRLYRSPLTLFLIGPAFQFILKHRLPLDLPIGWKKEWRSVLLTDLAQLALVLFAWQTIGLGALVKIQLPITMVSGSLGIFLFYVQHQFEETYWDTPPEWNFHDAAIEGSSFFDLPRPLHWATGNIGYHHIHHLSSLIPNYNLPRCMEEIPELSQVTRLNLWQSFKCVRLKLWDEESRRLIGFSDLRHLPKVSA